MKSVPSLAVNARRKPHELRQLAWLFGPNDEMKVIRHHTVRQKRKGDFRLGFGDAREKGPVVSRLPEETRSADASVQDVVDHATRHKSGSSRHVQR
jgi:hypothetical protein